MRIVILIFILVYGTTPAFGQQVVVNGGVLLKAQILLGNQNQGVKVGLYGVGAAHYGDVAIESGVAFYSGYLFKRHTVKTSGLHYGYDVFALVGIGKNENLLGSSFHTANPLIYERRPDQKFYGLGFGFEKEYLPENLQTFNQRLGKLLMRFSNQNHSINVQFKNDFKFGRLFNGNGTDYGNTGMFMISYSHILDPLTAYQYGAAVTLFTPEPDYSRTPDNQQNSDDGSKNVWYTKAPLHKLFYANLYAFGAYQDETVSAFAKAGLNSQKLGAYIQNTLHDSFGLNPRFPWNTAEKDKGFYELSGSLYNIYEND